MAKHLVKLVAYLPMDEYESRQTCNAEGCCKLTLLIGIDLINYNLILIFFCQLLQYGGQPAARSAPVGVKIDDGWFASLIDPFVRILLIVVYLFYKLRLVDVNNLPVCPKPDCLS